MADSPRVNKTRDAQPLNTQSLNGKRRSGPPELNSGQKLMVFVLSMTLFGLATILTEIIPRVHIGPVDLKVSYLVFVPLVMVALFNPLWAALGAPLGEIVFVDLLMGDFSGIGELEGYLQMFLGLYIAGCLIRDPRNRWQLGLAAMVVVLVDKFLSAIVDIAKVWVGVEGAEYVPGLPQSILLLEAIDVVIALVISGFLLGVLPAIALAPRLHGKIEPLLGLPPRDPRHPIPLAERGTAAFMLLALFLSFVAMIAAFTSAIFDNFGVWEPDFLDQYGARFLWVGVSAALLALIGLILATRFVIASRRGRAAQKALSQQAETQNADPRTAAAQNTGSQDTDPHNTGEQK